jgi:hypothetical protein
VTDLDVQPIVDDEQAMWLGWRKEGLGGSDIAAAFTGHYGGAYGVVASKLGYDLPADALDPDGRKSRGHRWEQRVADAVVALTGYYTHYEQAWIESSVNSVHRITCDGLLDPRPEVGSIDDCEAPLEVKTVGDFAPWKRDYWEIQTQWQMHVTGKPRALLVVAKISDVDDTCVGLPILEWVQRDDFMISVLVDLANDLWAHVTAGTFPDPDQYAPVELVKLVHGQATPIHGPTRRKDAEIPDPTVNIDHLAADLVRYHETICPRFATVKTEKELLEKRFRAAMGSGVLAETSDGSWQLRVGQPIPKFTDDSEADALAIHPDYARTVLDRSRFKEELPAEYEALKRPTTDRRLTVRPMKQKTSKPKKTRKITVPSSTAEQEAF